MPSPFSRIRFRKNPPVDVPPKGFVDLVYDLESESLVLRDSSKTKTPLGGELEPPTIEGIPGLQDELDSKETPAGAAAQIAVAGRKQPTEIVFYDEKRALDLPAHDGSITTTHPSVVDAGPSGWNGYRFWMAHTPWPSGAREQPNIICSHNMVDWVVPTGLVNPIATHTTVNAALGSSLYGFLADTELEFTSDNKLRCYYIAPNFSPARCGVIMQESTDGVVWTTPVRVITDTTNNARLLSPAVVRNGATWYMWVVDRDTSLSEHLRVRRYDSADGIVWNGPTECTLPTGPLVVPWHLYVHLANGVYHMLLNTSGDITWNSPLLYFTSSDGITWAGDPNVTALDPVGTYDGERYYRSCMIPADPLARTWHVFAAGLPHEYTTNGVTGNPWRIGLRPNMYLANRNRVTQNSFGLSTTSFSLNWKSNIPIASGATVDICKPSTKFTEGAAPAQVRAEIWGGRGTTAIGGIWVMGQFNPTQISTGTTTTTTFRGSLTPYLQLSALPDNVTPTSGVTVTGVTSGATAKFHRIRNTTPAQYSLREFSGTVIFTVGEQLQIGGVTLTNTGTPVTVSSLNSFPAATAINLIYVDSVAGYPGRYQIWNSYAAGSADVAVKIESNR